MSLADKFIEVLNIEATLVANLATQIQPIINDVLDKVIICPVLENPGFLLALLFLRQRQQMRRHLHGPRHSIQKAVYSVIATQKMHTHYI
jgi:hypothetical protein